MTSVITDAVPVAADVVKLERSTATYARLRNERQLKLVCPHTIAFLFEQDEVVALVGYVIAQSDTVLSEDVGWCESKSSLNVLLAIVVV